MKSRLRLFHALIPFALAALLFQGNTFAARPVVTDDEDQILWTFDARGKVSSAALSPDGFTLYISSQDHRLHAIDAFSGEEKWTNSLKFPGTLSSPVIDENGRIYVGCSDGRLYGILDREDFGEIDLRSTSLQRPLTIPAIAEDGTVYAGVGKRLYALLPDFPGFAPLWYYIAPYDVSTPVIADDGTVLIVTGGFLRGISDVGDEVSSFQPRSAIHSLPAVAEDGTIYIGANDERVYAIGSGGTTNDVLWRFNTGKNVTSSAAIGADGRVYIASENSKLYCFTVNGVVRWKTATKAPIRSAISIGVDGTIYAGCDDGRLYAFSPEDGTILWTVKGKGAVRSSPVLDAFGVVYFGAGKTVYAVQTEAMADDSDEPAWPMFRKNAQHTAQATECRPFLIEEPHRLGDTTGSDRFDATNGAPLSIAVVVRAGASVSYQWRLNGVEIDPEINRTATNATFIISSVSAADTGDYTVHAFNDCGEVESDQIFTVSLTNAAPVLTSNITNQLLLAGSALNFQIGAAGTPPLAYQWFFNSNAIPSATAALYSIANAQPADSGVYFVRITNPYGTNESFHANVTVFSNVLTLASHPIAAGQRHSLAVLPDKTLWAWGLNNFGQLGDGNSGSTGTNVNVFRSSPQLIGTNASVTTNAVWASVSGGGRGYDVATNQPGGFSIGIQTNGTLWAWGLNDRGQLGIDSFGSQLSPIQVGVDTNWVQAEAGATHVLALKHDGTLWSWGANESGQLGIGTSISNSAVPVRVGADAGWVEVRAGGFFSLARRADGTIWAWGTNGFGQLGIGANTGTNATRRAPVMVGTNNDWIAISAGVSHGLGLKANGTLWSWGRNNFGQLGLGLGSGNGNDTSNANRPAQIGSASDWGAVEAGNSHSFAISTGGNLFAWGANFFGQLGNGSMGSNASTNDQNKVSPVAVAADKTWRTVDASSHSLGITIDGNVWAWGWNGNGQVGDGTGGDGSKNNNRSLPVLLSFNADTNIVATNPPVIVTQPVNQAVNENVSATFSSATGGTPPFAYQWYFNSNAIASASNTTATNSSLTFASVTGGNAGFYFVIVTNNFGRATSTVAQLTVGITNGAPIIVQGPASQAVSTNTTVIFSVSVAGAAPFTYQWRFNANPIESSLTANANTASLTLSNVISVDQGFYDVIVTNIFGRTTSSPPAQLSLTNVSESSAFSILRETRVPDELRIQLVALNSNGVSVAVAGETNAKTFVLEYKDSLGDGEWKPLSTNDANGLILLDPSPPLDRSRYYRVRAE